MTGLNSHRQAKRHFAIRCKCGSSFLTIQELDNHCWRSSAHAACRLCGEIFDDDDDLRKHQRGVSLEVSGTRCTCGKLFWNELALEQHLASPTQRHGHVCLPCKLEFENRIDYMCHDNLRHSVDPPLALPIATRAQGSSTSGIGNPSLICRVCLEIPEELAATACGHMYCRPCIVGAIRENGTCPTCRSPAWLHDLRDLYL